MGLGAGCGGSGGPPGFTNVFQAVPASHCLGAHTSRRKHLLCAVGFASYTTQWQFGVASQNAAQERRVLVEALVPLSILIAPWSWKQLMCGYSVYPGRFGRATADAKVAKSSIRKASVNER